MLYEGLLLFRILTQHFIGWLVPGWVTLITSDVRHHFIHNLFFHLTFSFCESLLFLVDVS